MRVLIIKTSSLGDVVHTLPALTDAARAIPGIVFDWVVEEGFAEIPTWHPAVDQVIPVAIRRWRKNLWQIYKNGQWRAFKQALRGQSYDLVIDAQGLLKSAWLTRYVNAPIAGFDKASAREPIATRFYDHSFFVAREQHAVERVRALFAQALGYALPQATGQYGLKREALAAVATEPYVVFLHGTTWPSKHWPETHWQALAKALDQQGVAVYVPWSNDTEYARAQLITAHLEHAKVLPRMNLAGVVGVIASARACVAVDTGLGHLAAALDVPTVSLYGPTRPERVGAYGQGQVHLCATGANAGGGDRNLPAFEGLDAARVLGALEPLLAPV